MLEIKLLKPIAIFGVVLIVLGALVLITQSVTFFGSRKIIDFGPIQASVHGERTIPLSPLLGGLMFAGGIALVIVGRKKS